MASSGADDQASTQLERLTFFSDAVFAIAITLLVIEVRVPEIEHFGDAALGQALLDLLPSYIGFLSSFFVIGRFWVGHHQLFGMLKASDQRLVWTNLILLMTVAFMPFPTAVFSEYVQLRAGVGLYCLWLVLLGLMNHRVAVVALGGRRLVRDNVEGEACRIFIRNTWIPVLIGATAFVAGMVTPLLSLVALAVASPLISIAVHRTGRRHNSPSDETDTAARVPLEPAG
jgi:uncharacterized membrane protein